MNTYSFRAECEHDVTLWQAVLPTLGAQAIVSIAPSKIGDTWIPDVTVEVKTDASFDTIMHSLRYVPDGHVMVETLRPCPLAENSLERRYPS